MKYKNFWTLKRKEKVLLKIIEWAHKNGIKVEMLSKEQMLEAIQS